MASRTPNHQEGLKFARILMVLSSLSPLFILWAIRGNSLIPDFYFVGVCTLMVIVPTFFPVVSHTCGTKRQGPT